MGKFVRFPSVRGHEVAGVVQRVGPDARDVRVGDHVVGSLIAWCGACAPCRAGRPTRCRDPRATLRGPDLPPRLTLDGRAIDQGHGLGGFAEVVLTHENQLTVVDPAIPFPQAAIIGCSTITGAGTVHNVADLQPGESVLVVGSGTVGLTAVNAARAAGAEPVVAVDRDPRKLDTARAFGATHVIDSSTASVETELATIAPDGVDHAMDLVGLATTQELCWRVLAVGGTAYLMGMSAHGTIMSIDTAESHRAQKTLKQVYLGAAAPRRDIPRYAQMYLDGLLELDALVSQTISIDDIDAAYAQLERGEVLRSVITF